MNKFYLLLISIVLIACGNQQNPASTTENIQKYDIKYEIFSFDGPEVVSEAERGPIVKSFKEDFKLYVKTFDKNLNKQQLADLTLKIMNTYKSKYPMCPKISVRIFDETGKNLLHYDFWRKK